MDNQYPTSPELELYLSIRFSASLPDVLLEIASPKTTTTAGLKRLIRTRLPPELSTHRLRLIYAGKSLEDSTPLFTSLKLSSLPPPPRNEGSHPPYTTAGSSQSPPILDDNEDEGENKDKKGKTPIRNEPQTRIYIHCSIGDVELSATDLAAEASIASTTTATSSKARDITSSHSPSADTTAYYDYSQQHGQSATPDPTTGVSTTTPAPRGFDTLISAGLSEAEIAALRAQFLAVHSQDRTPETMPSAAEMQALEERWLENTDGRDASGDRDAGGAGGGGGDDNRGASPLDDMLWGSVMGFFWPVGCAVWLLREDGVWSWRKGLAVFMGFLINLILGTVRMVG